MAGIHCRRLKLVVGLVLVCSMFATSGSALEMGEAEISLRSTTKYQVQWSDSPADFMTVDDDIDQDFYENLMADVNWLEHGLTFSTMASYVKDIDGTPEGSIFQDYTDSRGSDRQDFELYYAYLEKTGLLDDTLSLRAGRQYTYGAETVHYDGLWAGFEIHDWMNMELEAFGGKVVQHYTSLGQDAIGGANLRIHPIKGLALDLNAVFFEEISWNGGLYWQAADYLTMRSEVAFINSHLRFIDAGFTATNPGTETILDFSFYRRYPIASTADYLFDFSYTVDEALSSEMNRLYLMQEEGYLEFDLRLIQPIHPVEGLNVFVRYTKRTMDHDDKEDIYNTDFQRITGGFDLAECFGLHGFKMSTGISRWWEDRDKYYEGDSTSWFVDMSQEVMESLELEAGYYHKNENVNSLLEDEASTRYRAAVAYKVDEHSELELAYEYTEDDFYEDELGVDHINTMTVTLDVEF